MRAATSSERRRAAATPDALACAALVLTLSVGLAHAGSLYLGVDIPSKLDGSDYRTNEFVLGFGGGSYGLVAALPAGSVLAGLHRSIDGSWLFALEHDANLGGTDYDRRDVISWDFNVYGSYLDGSVAGVPDYAAIDAVMLDYGGKLVVSFDVPVNLGGTEYLPADLVKVDGSSFVSYWDSAAAGVPLSVNVVGASTGPLGELLFTFDVPATLDGETFLPGEVVQWDNNLGFRSWSVDGAWPPGSALTGVAAVPAAGAVPDGAGVPGNQLMVNKAAAGQVTLSWGPSCIGSDFNYVVYQGNLGDFDSHERVTCGTAGATTHTFTPGNFPAYFLVGAHNGLAEGSLGTASDGTERGRGTVPCYPRQVGSCN
jgi:hypothetical protein